LSAKSDNVNTKWVNYFKNAGRIMGFTVQSDTAITGGGDAHVALYRNGSQIGSDYAVGTSFCSSQSFYLTANMEFDYNVRGTTTDEDYFEVKLYTSGTVTSTHDGVVVLYALFDVPNTDCVSYNFDPADVSTANDTITLPAGHTLTDGDRVVYKTAGTAIGGLTSSLFTGIYYVVNTNGNDIELSATEGGASIDLTTQGVGEHTVTRFASSFSEEPYG